MESFFVELFIKFLLCYLIQKLVIMYFFRNARKKLAILYANNPKIKENIEFHTKLFEKTIDKIRFFLIIFGFCSILLYLTSDINMIPYFLGVIFFIYYDNKILFSLIIKK